METVIEVFYFVYPLVLATVLVWTVTWTVRTSHQESKELELAKRAEFVA